MSSTNVQPIVYLTRCESFSASHRLHSRFSFSSQLTDQQNREIFGKCNNIPFGWHANKACCVRLVKVTVRKSVDPVTGMAMNLNDLKLHLQLTFKTLCTEGDRRVGSQKFGQRCWIFSNPHQYCGEHRILRVVEAAGYLRMSV
ncbi:6-pyruvoyl tetrahydrobiopterin synthase [Trichinella spiralis]|uniref:6-pyruvoyl tetrahydrobiopterin synthase n=1 Tax=Trichinella spiralis TaxID=6334 RepID=UPI0001EFE77E|nr:6-pyruvoyl tetrahydrobiopterin synthase [Trichinella spiralis]